MIELCLWYTFRGFPTFRNFCVITLSGYFATPLRLLCVATNLVVFQNVGRAGDVQTNTRRGAQHQIGIVGNFVGISVKLHRYKISK